jgi:hypothetical protein
MEFLNLNLKRLNQQNEKDSGSWKKFGYAHSEKSGENAQYTEIEMGLQDGGGEPACSLPSIPQEGRVKVAP